MNTIIVVITATLVLCTSCSNVSEHGRAVFEKDPTNGISAVPADMERIYRKAFDRYTAVIAPWGGRIHIVAQNRISNEQIIRARGILEHYLSDTSCLLFGGVKGDLADRMAANGAVLTLLNYRDDGSNKTRAPGQALFEEELPVEGDAWYTENMYEGHRDAAFEEILHLVHDYGIGVDGRGGLPGALPEYQQKIRSAQEEAIGRIWADNAGSRSWLRELEGENSLTQEYFAAVVDSWYGLWGAWSDPSIANSTERGMWGEYTPKTREEVYAEDPAGAALAEEFLCPWLAYNARIDQRFTGVFSLRFTEEQPYTHKSRYLRNVTLTGSGDSGVRVNGYDNTITGNSGFNRVYFSGASSEYTIEDRGTANIVSNRVAAQGGNELITIEARENVYIVSDSIAERDGANTLVSIEELVFSDTRMRL